MGLGERRRGLPGAVVVHVQLVVGGVEDQRDLPVSAVGCLWGCRRRSGGAGTPGALWPALPRMPAWLGGRAAVGEGATGQPSADVKRRGNPGLVPVGLEEHVFAIAAQVDVGAAVGGVAAGELDPQEQVAARVAVDRQVAEMLIEQSLLPSMTKPFWLSEVIRRFDPSRVLPGPMIRLLAQGW